MPSRENIYRFRALLILLVFGFSLLPRQVIHNFVTNHKHVRYTAHPGHEQLSAASFSCSADDVFLQQHYLLPGLDIITGLAVQCASNKQLLVSYYFNDKRELTALRGPPAMV